jgi:hypothetical protein
MNTNLCPYKYFFGKPNEGAHSYRLFNIALVDFFGTILISYLISKYYNLNIYEVLMILFLLGIILHRLFCVKTTIDKLIFN